MTSLTDWLIFNRAPAIGPATIKALLHHFSSLDQVYDCPRKTLHDMGLPATAVDALYHPDMAAIERELEWQAEPGQHILSIEDPRYPRLLTHIPAAPPVLYVQGDPAALSTPQIAIVGSRNPSSHGTKLAYDFASELSSGGLTVTSGLALGIDAASHRGALAVGGTTIAVTATGLDRVYPARHQALAAEIVSQRGALVSEFPLGTRPRKDHFPRRNRIISGLSLGTLVVEAALKSGSLITARLAADQGRDVFAVPGSITNPTTKGCHALIKQGAKLVEAADDIIEEIAPEAILTEGDLAAKHGTDVVERTLTGNHKRIYQHLGFDAIPIETLVELSGLTVREISAVLTELQLQGCVTAISGGLYARQA
jgi:DNA processing protein